DDNAVGTFLKLKCVAHGHSVCANSLTGGPNTRTCGGGRRPGHVPPGKVASPSQCTATARPNRATRGVDVSVRRQCSPVRRELSSNGGRGVRRSIFRRAFAVVFALRQLCGRGKRAVHQPPGLALRL